MYKGILSRVIEAFKRIKITVQRYKSLHYLALFFAITGAAMPFIISFFFLGTTESYGVISSVYGNQNTDVLSPEPFTYSSFKELGPLGDWIAGTSVPLLTLAGFTILFATFKIQRKELDATKEQLHHQNFTLGKQRFDSNFYNLVQLHHEIVRGIGRTEIKTNFLLPDRPSISIQKSGREVLKDLVNNSGILSPVSKKDELFNSYTNMYNDNDDILGHYYRNLFNIIRLIDKSTELNKADPKTLKIDKKATFDERKTYIRIIRAQLSFSELILIFYNSFTEAGKDFRDYIITYQLLNRAC